LRSAVAVGSESASVNLGAIAIGAADGGGWGTVATGAFSTAIGGGDSGSGVVGARADGNFAFAVGGNSRANAANSIAIGGSAATGPGGAAFVNAAATNGIAFGNGAQVGAGGSNAMALGNGANAGGASSTAVGNGAAATFANSTAIGNGATVTRANQQSFGTAANTYTMSGITSAASLAAQTGPVSFVTTDAAGNLAASTFNPGSVAVLDGRVTNLENSVNNLNFNVRKAFEGAAVAIAMGGSALPDNKRFAISANWGNFSGENAFGGMAQMRISNNFVANAAIGAGFARGGVGGRVGGTFAW
jgi:hypothetical protein